MVLWCVAIVLFLFCLEAIVYLLYMLINLLKEKPLHLNLTLKKLRRFIIGNVLICSLLIGISYGYNSYVYIGKNEIRLTSQREVKEVAELLDDSNMNYKISFGNKIKMQNWEDIQSVIRILNDNGISYIL